MSNDKVKLKNKGVKKINALGRGNMYVIYDVYIPDKLTMTQKKLIKELAETKLDDSPIFKNFNKYL